MTEHSSWPVGAPAWVDLSVSDIDRSREFYTQVLGWDYQGGEPEFGGYVNATVDGKVVAGMAPPMEGQDEMPHFWTTYLKVDDSQAHNERIAGAGGAIVLPPMEVGPFGWMALYTDPTGALFGTWQPGSHEGFQLFGQPGALAWCEAMVGDFERGQQFYADAFGWTYQDYGGDGMKYAIFSVPGQADPMGSGGIGQDPDNPQPYWAVTFGVDGTDEAVERVRAAGGGVMVEPFDFEFGRLAIVTGPDGEPFGLITSPAGGEQAGGEQA